jgi:hypothetical protein
MTTEQPQPVPVNVYAGIMYAKQRAPMGLTIGNTPSWLRMHGYPAAAAWIEANKRLYARGILCGFISEK